MGWAAEPVPLDGWVEGVRGVDGVLEPEFWFTFGAGLRLLFSGNRIESIFIEETFSQQCGFQKGPPKIVKSQLETKAKTTNLKS